MRRQGVVVAVEGEEGGELHPAVAELFVRVALEATGVDAEHGDAEEGEGEGLRDGEEHVCEQRGVVAAPVTGPFPGAGEGRATDDERPFARNSSKESLVGRVEDLVAKQIVDIIFDGAIVVSSIGGYGMHGQITLDIVDDIRRMVDISDTWRWDSTEVSRGG